MIQLIDLQSVTLQPRSGATASHLVIFLHGYGSDQHDLISLGEVFGERLPDCAFVSAAAPFPCEMGMGRQWFSLADRSPAAMLPAVKAAIPTLDRFIDGEAARWGLQPRDIALVGFSQGTMMALAVGLARAEALGGIVGFSGALLEAGAIVSRPPVLLVHGEADTVVPFAALAHARTVLREKEVAVESLARPGLGHGIDAAGIEAALSFLDRYGADRCLRTPYL